MSDPRLAIARRELASLRSEKTIVLALLIQLFVATFSSFLVVGLVSLYDPGSVDGQTISVGVSGNATDRLVEVAEEERGIALIRFDSEAEAAEEFGEGDVSAYVVAERLPNGTIDVTANVPQESLQTTLVVVKVQSTLERLERAQRERFAARLNRQPLDPGPEASSTPYFGFTYTVLVPLLMFLPVFISGSVAVDSLTEELERGTLDLLRVAPVSLVDIVDAKLLATASLAPVQAALWLALLSATGTSVVHPLALVATVAALGVAVVAVGLGISLLAAERRQAQLLYSSGLLLVAVAAALLPEHPANTVAKFAVGSTTTGTWLALAGYGAIGVGALLAVRTLVARSNPDDLGR